MVGLLFCTACVHGLFTFPISCLGIVLKGRTIGDLFGQVASIEQNLQFFYVAKFLQNVLLSRVERKLLTMLGLIVCTFNVVFVDFAENCFADCVSSTQKKTKKEFGLA